MKLQLPGNIEAIPTIAYRLFLAGKAPPPALTEYIPLSDDCEAITQGWFRTAARASVRDWVLEDYVVGRLHLGNA